MGLWARECTPLVFKCGPKYERTRRRNKKKHNFSLFIVSCSKCSNIQIMMTFEMSKYDEWENCSNRYSSVKALSLHWCLYHKFFREVALFYFKKRWGTWETWKFIGKHFFIKFHLQLYERIRLAVLESRDCPLFRTCVDPLESLFLSH